jgi:Tfp pilus assembly protein PilF
VLRLDPNNLVSHYNLAQAYTRKGLKSEAGKHFRMALKLNPDLIPAQKALESLDPKLK